MESISQAEKKIDVLTDKVGISDEGALWIKETLDPFCDMPRRPVGFPDMITGNSVLQVIKQSRTFSIGATPQDVHVFMDTIDSSVNLAKNSFYGSPVTNGGAIIGDAVGGLGTHVRGGVVVRQGPVGSPLTPASTVGNMPLDTKFLEAGSTRVLAKGFEIHNTTNKLNVGGAITVYRDTGSTPYEGSQAITCFAAGSDSVNITHSAKLLTEVPETLSEVTLIPGSQQWEAKDGCMIVGTMSSQTNNPHDEHYGMILAIDRSAPTTGVFANVHASGTPGKPPELNALPAALASPYFLSGAYLTGLPAGTELTVNTIMVIERFVDASNVDLVVLAQPSPFFDAAALEVYSKTAQRLPHGVKVSDNADGDWIKNIADVLSTFGVPGMPLVKGGVDLYNAWNNGTMKANKSKEEKARVRNLEQRAIGTYVGSPQHVSTQSQKLRLPRQQQQKRQPKQYTKQQLRQMRTLALPPPMNAPKVQNGVKPKQVQKPKKKKVTKEWVQVVKS